LGLCVFLLSVLCLFWAVQFRSEDRLHNLTVWVVDFDNQVEPYKNESITPIVGPAVTDVANRFINSHTEHIGYKIRSPADFNYDPWAVRQGVYDEHAFAAIIVNPNATTLLYDAVMNGNSSYDPNGAAQFIINSARDQTTYSNVIDPILSSFQLQVLAEFGPRWIRTLAQQSMDISRVPQAVNPAINFYRVDLRPFGPAAATPSVTIGLIYLIIIAFFNTPFLMPVHMQLIKGNHPPLKTAQWLVWRLCSSIAAYFLLSLFYSFVSLAFQIPFSNSPAPDTLPADNPNAYGHGSFVVFWMLNWVGMTALGLPCENMGMILGFPNSALFLIFWVITNVATGFYPLDLAPGFFAWGEAWPLRRSKFPSLELLALSNSCSCRGPSDYSLRHAFTNRSRLWHSVCVDRSVSCAIPICRIHHALEDEARVVIETTERYRLNLYTTLRYPFAHSSCAEDERGCNPLC
jgi:hypothetical protein